MNDPVRPFPLRSANGDWVRALQRTARIEPTSTRTLASLVDENAVAHAARPALLGDDASLTHGELAALSRRYSRWALALGLRKGDRVALMMTSGPDYPAIWIGLARVGVVTALLNDQLVGDGLAHCLAAADATCAIVDADHLVALEAALGPGSPISVHGGASLEAAIADLDDGPLDGNESRPVALRDPALLIYTSGTTGLPKAAYVSHYRIMMWSEWFAGIMDARPDDRLYDCLPLYHSIGGVVAIGAMLAVGGSVVLRKTFSARRFWADVTASGATIFQYIGELCRYLTAAPPGDSERGHSLRLCCGNGLRADVWATFEARFAIPRIIEFYAATEGSFSLFNLEGKPGAIGRIPSFMAHRSPVALVRFDIETETPVRDAEGFCVRCDTDEAGEAIGLVAARATDLATRFEGYTNQAETERKILRDVFAEGDCWFRTGDLMRRDAQGFYAFVDRIGDTFRWKGENVATAAVADALCVCPGVQQALVYGVAVPGADGRAGMAALVVAPDFDPGSLWGQIQDSLPKFARPLFLRLRDTIETTGTFKPRKADYARDGFDPALVSDALYVDDGTAYRELDAERHAAIIAGTMRL